MNHLSNPNVPDLLTPLLYSDFLSMKELSISINGFFSPSPSDKEPHPNPTEKSKSPILLDETMYYPENLPLPIKSLNPMLKPGKRLDSFIKLTFKLKLLSL